MSEDSIKVEFNSKNLNDDRYREKLESIYLSYVPRSDTSTFLEYEGNKVTYIRGLLSSSEVDLASLLAELEGAGVTDLVVTGWYSSVGEETYHIRKNGKLLDFESVEDMEEHLKELQKDNSSIKVNYGKNSKNNTVLIRLHVKAKGKRKKLFELFLSTQTSLGLESFKENYKSSIKGNDLDIEWGRFKGYHGAWVKACSEELIHTLVDVQEDDEYLLLAFNLDKAPNNSYILVDDFIWMMFIVLDGVRKVWVKYRQKSRQHQYLYSPGMGDESFFVTKNIENDNDWPKL